MLLGDGCTMVWRKAFCVQKFSSGKLCYDRELFMDFKLICRIKKILNFFFRVIYHLTKKLGLLEQLEKKTALVMVFSF